MGIGTHGDIYLAEGDSEQAFAAYTSALDSWKVMPTGRCWRLSETTLPRRDGEFTVFSQPLNQALKRARETLATDESALEK